MYQAGGSIMSRCWGAAMRLLKNKSASSLFKDEAPKSPLAAVLAGDARDVRNLRRLGTAVSAD